MAASFRPQTELREAALRPESKPVVLVIDVQNFCAKREGGEFKDGKQASEYYWSAVESAIGKAKALLASARAVDIEVIYTTIESLTVDGRDRSLDYKISGFNVPRGSWDAKVVDDLEPAADDIVLPKTSCSVFQSTTLGYILRNLECRQLVVCGGLTDQCVESAVRDACDLGFLVTLATDACYCETEERHLSTLRAIKGFCRQRPTAAILEELAENFPPDEVGRSAPSALGAEYVRFELTDMNAKSLHKLVPARHATKDTVYFYSGAMAMGANADLLTFPSEVADAGCPNWRAIPQWETVQRVPWTPRTARVLCELENCPATPRTVCRCLLDELGAKHGVRVLAAAEYEFTLAKKVHEEWVPYFDGVDIFATLQFQKVQDFAIEVERRMLQADIDVKTLNCEYGAGQLEITYAPSYGIEAGDAAATFKLGVKEMAASRGLRASFMSKPFGVNAVGNGGHFNHSLWQNGVNVTGDGADGPSSLADRWISGILHHAPALEALCAPTPPCYLRHGHWAPTHANWGPENRMCAIRAKLNPNNPYLELRMPSASANAYLVLAAIVAAGMHGIEDATIPSRPPGEAAETAMPLPTSLPEALDALQRDEYLKAKLGADFVRWFDLLKRSEIETIEKNAQTLGSDAKAWELMYMEYL